MVEFGSLPPCLPPNHIPSVSESPRNAPEGVRPATLWWRDGALGSRSSYNRSCHLVQHNNTSHPHVSSCYTRCDGNGVINDQIWNPLLSDQMSSKAWECEWETDLLLVMQCISFHICTLIADNWSVMFVAGSIVIKLGGTTAQKRTLIVVQTVPWRGADDVAMTCGIIYSLTTGFSVGFGFCLKVAAQSWLNVRS